MQAGGPAAANTTPQVALLGNPFGLPNVLPVLAPLLVPTAEELLAAASSALVATVATAAAAAALPVALTLGLILLSTTPAQAPGIPQTAYPPVDPDAARLNQLETQHATGTLTVAGEKELVDLLAKVKGIQAKSLADLNVTGNYKKQIQSLPDFHFEEITYTKRSKADAEAA